MGFHFSLSICAVSFHSLFCIVLMGFHSFIILCFQLNGGFVSKLMNKAVEVCCFNGWFITALFVSISLLTYIVQVDLIGTYALGSV